MTIQTYISRQVVTALGLNTLIDAVNQVVALGAMSYQGSWNASTNTPALASGVGVKGYYYTVSVAGSTAIDGINSWLAGDKIAFNGTAWEKFDGLANEVVSVAGLNGAVSASALKTALAIVSGDIGDATTIGKQVLTAATAAAIKALLAIAASDVSGLGSLATLSSVDNAHLASMATLTLKGNNTGGSAAPLDLTATQVKALLAIVSADITDATTLGKTLMTTASAAAARVSLGVDGRTARGDANYTMLATDKFVCLNVAFTAARTFTLPAANSVNAGYALAIQDEVGAVSSANNLILARQGTDTINGGTSVTFNTPYLGIYLVSDGAGKWSVSTTDPSELPTVPLTKGGTGQTSAAGARGSSGINIESYTGVGDVAYTILSTDNVVGTTAAFTAARTWTLPAANSVNPGHKLLIADFIGGVTASNTLTISRAGTDTINGGSTVVLSSGYGGYYLVSDGTSKWTAQAIGTASATGVSSFNGRTGAVSPAANDYAITQLAAIAASSFVANNGGSSAAPAAITVAQARALLGLAAIATSGSAADLSAGTIPSARLGSGTANSTTYLRGDQVFTTFPTIQFSQVYDSGQQVCTAGTTLTLAHGLGVKPKLYMTCLQCVTADQGYSVGDEIWMTPEAPGSSIGHAVKVDATNITIYMGSGGFNAINTSHSGATLTSANWRMVVRAWA